MNPDHADDTTPTDDDLSDIEIETIGSWEPDIQERNDPRRDRALVTVRCGRPRGHPHVFIHADALHDALQHTRRDRKNEVGGVLLGDFYHSRGRFITDVRGAMEAPATRAGVSHVTFSHETWAEINRRKDDECPDMRIVGWYHSHPNIGVFLSNQDMFIQRNFFDDDGHVALVIDPVRREVVLYTKYVKKGKKDVYAARGFYVTAPARQPDKARALADLRYTVPGARRRRPGFLARLLRRDPSA